MDNHKPSSRKEAFLNTASQRGIMLLKAYLGEPNHNVGCLPVACLQASFHLDVNSPVQWGASLAQGPWQLNSNKTNTKVVVSLLDLPAFVADVVRPMLVQDQYDNPLPQGRRPPSGMKLDVEGEEYALLPSLITNGGLCDLSMIYIELHGPGMRTPDGMLTNLTTAEMEGAFAQLRAANPRCTVHYTHLDDETYLHADTELPLPSDR